MRHLFLKNFSHISCSYSPTLTLLRRLFQSLFSSFKKQGFAVNVDVASSSFFCGLASGTRTTKHIQYHLTRQRRFLDQILEECHWFLCGVLHILGWYFIEVENIAVTFAEEPPAGFVGIE